MKFTLDLPMNLVDPEFQTPAPIKEMAEALERSGADACYITDHPAPSGKWRDTGGHDALEPFAGLAFIAACTTRLRLHTNLVVLPYRNPFLTAKSVATLDVLSAGRVILGVGVGYMRAEYEALGVDFTARGALMDEAINVMKQAWSGVDVEGSGRGWFARGIRPRPLPVQRPNPPIWSGGNSERAMRRAALMCDGWSPFFVSGPMAKGVRTDEITSLEDLAEKIKRLRGFRDEAGLTAPFDICIGPQRGLQGFTKADAERYLDDLGELAKVGVTWSMCGLPHPSRQAYIEHVQWFSEEILPKARSI
jgi:probable F420-dependent oxidoreductase